MKSTEHFKQVLDAKLQQVASTDEMFAANLKKGNKNIDDCVTYILNTVQKSGCNGFTDDEVYGMAIHYYDEDNIEVGKEFDCRVVINHTVELTAEEIDQAKKQAREKIVSDEMDRLRRKDQKQIIKKPEVKTEQPSLF